MGAAESGEDSIASVVKKAEHWSDLRILILVVSLEKLEGAIMELRGFEVTLFLGIKLRKFTSKSFLPKSIFLYVYKQSCSETPKFLT